MSLRSVGLCCSFRVCVSGAMARKVFHFCGFVMLILIYFCDKCDCFDNFTGDVDPVNLKKVVADQCAKYSINCFLMDVYKLLDVSRSSNRYQVLPGVYLIREDVAAENISMDAVQLAVVNNQTDMLEVYVGKKLNAFLDALSLSLKIMDRNSAISVRKFSDNFITGLLPTINTGRGKKKGSKDAAVWAAGALAALGSSALFALSGKAVVASTVALILSIVCYFKGHGGSSHYTAASTAPLTSAYRHQCAEAIIDVNPKDYNSAVIGYRKRTLDEPWNYPRYASTPSSSEPSYGSHST